MAEPPSKNPTSFSQIPSRPSNPRNSEVNNPIRRSFSGSTFTKPSIITSQRPGFNPNTPANSPADHMRRSSIFKENVVVSLHDSEDKENSKDQNLKQVRPRSPASTKGTKNFMSPTISATSKIIASPRKKILTERNEPTCTSGSFTDCKNLQKEDSDWKPEKGLNQKELSFDPTITYLGDKDTSQSNEDFDSLVHSSIKVDWELPESATLEKGWKKEVVSLVPTITYLDDKDNLTKSQDFDSVVRSSTTDDWDSLSESAHLEKGCVNLDPSFKISPRASCSLAPLDADPSMPPYDPKTNYLSPRPRFLHYKPNPRIQMYLNRERDSKQLEESSASETSDTDVTEEETLSDDSQKESEDALSGDVMYKEEEEELLVSVPNPLSASEGAAEAKRVLKPNFFTKTKFNALLLILAIACLWASVTNSPVMDPPVLNNLSFPNPYVPPEISKFIRTNLEGLAHKFQQWIYDSFSYFHNLIVNFKEWLNPGPLQFANLTTLLEDGSADNHLLGDHSHFGAAVKYERNELRLTREGEIDIKRLEEEEDQLIEDDEKETDENIEEAVEEEKNDQEYEDKEVSAAHDIPDNVEVPGNDIVLESEGINMTLQAEVIEPDSTPTEVTQKSGSIGELQSNTDKNLLVPIPQAAEIQTEDSFCIQPPAENDKSSAVEEEKNDQEYEDKEVIAAHDIPDNVEVPGNDIVLESEGINMTLQAEVIEPDSTPTVVTQKSGSIGELQTNTDKNLLAPIPQAAEIQTEDSFCMQPPAENDKSSAATDFSIAGNTPESLDSNSGKKNPESSESVDLEIHRNKNLFSSQIVMGISLLVLGLLAAFAFIHTNNKASTKPNVAVAMDQAPLTKKLDYNPLTDVETVGESYPSEMSSFEHGSSYRKEGNKGTREAQGQGRKPRRNSRRESLASSDYSTESQSYGSFTTYEKILSKNGNGEEELFTPVRRSSRIRNHVTSS